MFLGNPTRRSFSSLLRRANILAGFLLGIAFFLPGSPVHAQAIIATVNGNPITDIDVDERMKLLRVLHQPASRDAALQSMIDDTLKLDETGKYKLKASDAEIGQQISREAVQLKMAPEALMVALEGAGIPEQHIKDHFAADYQFLTLIEAYNKGVEASETQVREELARSGGKSAAGVDYKVNQVIFTIFPSASPAEIAARMKAAEQFRTRFTDCDSGLSAARSMEDVAVRETITRNSL
ncbi:MAG TPA: SurA N-terminal domain-containing protein, partial [Methylovirgula sp.]|nr:SurA N-terminal domain-containing protein [Methylovirgula sp.]